MIHIVTATNRSAYVRQLQDMHRLRWGFYVDGRDWQELRDIQSEPGFERDELDDARAVYLLALDADGEIEGSMRVRPTEDQSLLFDRFPNLIEANDVQRGPDVWEITRLMRAPAHRGSDGLLRLKLNCAACEFALSRGITRYVSVIDTFLLRNALAFHGDKASVLGLPKSYREGEMVAVALTPDEELLEHARRLGGVEGKVMFEQPAPERASGGRIQRQAAPTRHLRARRVQNG